MVLSGDTLQIVGALQRDAVAKLWAALPAAPFQQIDLSAVTALDTAGLAWLMEVSAPDSMGVARRILNAPAAYHALCAAYRIPAEAEET